MGRGRKRLSKQAHRDHINQKVFGEDGLWKSLRNRGDDTPGSPDQYVYCDSECSSFKIKGAIMHSKTGRTLSSPNHGKCTHREVREVYADSTPCFYTKEGAPFLRTKEG
jgi:hypothetical protein